MAFSLFSWELWKGTAAICTGMATNGAVIPWKLSSWKVGQKDFVSLVRHDGAERRR